MKKLIVSHLPLAIVLVLAFILRFWNLGSYPALNADEAAIGYNAYSLIQTSLDEHGNPWPIHFQSFNDYKPGLYFYLVLPFVKFFGLNEWSVRTPNALLGVASVYILYFLVKELKIRNSLEIGNWKLEISEIAAFMLSISPWHLHFSRGGWEVNTSTFFIVAGVYCFLKALHHSKFYILPTQLAKLCLSSIFFVLSLYTYHAARIVTPFMIIGLLGIYYSDIRKNLRNYFLSALIAFICLLPLVKDILRSEISSRAAGVGLFADSGPVNRINEQRGEHSDFNSVTTKVMHNKAANYTLAFFENWAAHYHGLFLFLSGDDIERNKVPETGQMYMLDALWIVIGLWWMVKNWNKEIRVIIHWVLIAPVAAALTFQSPHALRAENMAVPLVIIAAVGFVVVLVQVSRISSISIRRFVYLSICLFVLLGFARYEHMYWTHMSREYPYSSQYGVKELVGYISENEDKFKNVLVTTKYDQPYILFLFYSKYQPELFQLDHELTPKDRYGFSTVGQFDKYVFKPINWEEDRLQYPNSMIIGTPDEIPKEANIIKKIYGINGFEYFEIVAN